MNPPAELPTANQLAGTRTDLAIERTLMAARRTMMGWVRTALSLISFGFTIYKFLQGAAQGGSVGRMRVQGPRNLGLFLIALGTLSVIMGSIEYFESIRRLGPHDSGTRRHAWNFTLILGVIIGLLGLFLFLTILTNSEVF